MGIKREGKGGMGSIVRESALADTITTPSSPTEIRTPEPGNACIAESANHVER